jgi:hypothetical protein
MVRQTRCIIGLTTTTAVVAIVATTFTGLQWWEAHTGGVTAEKQADAASDVARAAIKQVNVAREQVTVTEVQTNAVVEMAGAAVAQAVAARAQASAVEAQGQIARSQLSLFQAPNIDVILQKIEPYDFNSGFEATFLVTNTGAYSIRKAKAYIAVDVLAIDEINTIWGKLGEPLEIDLVPGANNNHVISAPFPPLTQIWWNRLVSRQATMVHALRLTFTDAAGKPHVIERCAVYNGAITQFRRTEDCNTRRQW